MAYPAIAAGQRITAGLLRSMLPLTAYKTADTLRTSTATLADDPDLQIPLEANATYFVEFFVHYATVTAAGFKTAWTVPPGAGGLRSAWGSASGVASLDAEGDGRWGVHGFSTTCAYGNRTNTNQLMVWETGDVVTGATAGTVAIQWAQVTSNAGQTRVAARSFARATRIA